jgi:hypothetical protein
VEYEQIGGTDKQESGINSDENLSSLEPRGYDTGIPWRVFEMNEVFSKAQRHPFDPKYFEREILDGGYRQKRRDTLTLRALHR